jgi:hypothetical protein
MNKVRYCQVNMTPGANSNTLESFLCLANALTDLRYATGFKTCRYLNSEFFDITPRPCESAYHTSELDLIFGTSTINCSETECGQCCPIVGRTYT